MTDLSKLSDADLQALHEGRLQDVSDEGLLIASGKAQEEPGLGMQALDYGGRALDYAGGVGRTAAAGLANIPYFLATGESLTQEGDVTNALKGKAPSTSEFLDRAGVEELGSLSELLPGMYSEDGEEFTKFKKGGALDITGRGAIGFVGDTLLDPLTYLTAGASRAGGAVKAGQKSSLLNKVVNPIETMTRARGESMWKKALQPLDAAAEKANKGANAVSTVAIENNIARGPTMRSNMKQLADHAGKLYDEQRGLLRNAQNSPVDPDDVVRPLEELSAQHRVMRDPEAQAVADALDEKVRAIRDAISAQPALPPRTVQQQVPSSILDEFGQPMMTTQTTHIPGASAIPGVNPEAMSDIKTFWGKDVAGGKWEKYAPTKIGDEAKIAQYRGAKVGTENAVSKADTAWGERLKQVNKELEAILSTRKKQLGEVSKAEAKELITSVDAPMAGFAMAKQAQGDAQAGALGMTMLALKKARDISKAAGPRSWLGSKSFNLGAGRSVGGPRLIQGMDIGARRSLYEMLLENELTGNKEKK